MERVLPLRCMEICLFFSPFCGGDSIGWGSWINILSRERIGPDLGIGSILVIIVFSSVIGIWVWNCRTAISAENLDIKALDVR